MLTYHGVACLTIARKTAVPITDALGVDVTRRFVVARIWHEAVTCSVAHQTVGAPTEGQAQRGNRDTGGVSVAIRVVFTRVLRERRYNKQSVTNHVP